MEKQKTAFIYLSLFFATALALAMIVIAWYSGFRFVWIVSFLFGLVSLIILRPIIKKKSLTFWPIVLILIIILMGLLLTIHKAFIERRNLIEVGATATDVQDVLKNLRKRREYESKKLDVLVKKNSK